MRAADHLVIAEEGCDFSYRVIELFLCCYRHPVGTDFQSECDRADDNICPHQCTLSLQVQVIRQGWCVGD